MTIFYKKIANNCNNKKMWVVFLSTLSMMHNAYAVDFQGISLGIAGPGQSNFNFGILVTGDHKLNSGNNDTQFNLNLGVANTKGTSFSGNGTLNGDLYLDPGATIESSLTEKLDVNGSIKALSLSPAVADVQKASNNAKLLLPDPGYEYGDLEASATIRARTTSDRNQCDGINTAIKLNSINLSKDNKLTIDGGSHDYFIINVKKSIVINKGQVILTGGVTADHVLFNVLGTGDSVKIDNPPSSKGKVTYEINGNFLAPFADQKMKVSTDKLNGALIAYDLSTSNGQIINGMPYNAECSSSFKSITGVSGPSFWYEINTEKQENDPIKDQLRTQRTQQLKQ